MEIGVGWVVVVVTGVGTTFNALLAGAAWVTTLILEEIFGRERASCIFWSLFEAFVSGEEATGAC